MVVDVDAHFEPAPDCVDEVRDSGTASRRCCRNPIPDESLLADGTSARSSTACAGHDRDLPVVAERRVGRTPDVAS
jgi:hypothetical protein